MNEIGQKMMQNIKGEMQIMNRWHTIIIIMFAKSLRDRKALREESGVNAGAVGEVFSVAYHAEIFYSRCQDTGQKADIEKAKMFRDALIRVNTRPQILHLDSMRLGVNTIMKLISVIQTQGIKELSLADNSISQYGMHAIKNLLSSTQLQSLNLASNMISETGLALILEECIKSSSLKMLDLGVHEGSARKNSFGVDGARCLAAILLQNRTLEVLKLEDNDVGISGAEVLSIPLKKNRHLKHFKLAENLIKTQGAEYILINAMGLVSLDLGKNFIKSSVGPTIKKYIQQNTNLQSLNLEFNELGPQGVHVMFRGIVASQISQLNLKGNALGDRGLFLISQILSEPNTSLSHLRILDLSFNEITAQGISHIALILQQASLKELNLSKNQLSDVGLSRLLQSFFHSKSATSLQKLQLSACKICDKGFLQLMECLNTFVMLKHLRVCDNYVSDKFQKTFVELFEKNHTITVLALSGNRMSLSGIKTLKRIVQRNGTGALLMEPTKMRSQILLLKEKQKKVKDAKDIIEDQRKQLSEKQQLKKKLNLITNKLEEQQREKQKQLEEYIKQKTDQIDQIREKSSLKTQELQSVLLEKERNIQVANAELKQIRENREQLQYQLRVAKDQSQALERDFAQKVKTIN